MEARAVGPCVGEQKPLGKTPMRGNPSPGMTYPYLPTCSVCGRAKPRRGCQLDAHESSPVPYHIFHSVSIDFIKLSYNPVKRNGKTYDVVLLIDSGQTKTFLAELSIDKVVVVGVDC